PPQPGLYPRLHRRPGPSPVGVGWAPPGDPAGLRRGNRREERATVTSPIARLNEYGQSPWYDNIRRSLLESGELTRMITEDGIRGVTSNPTIFEKAISAGTEYDDTIQALARQG